MLYNVLCARSSLIIPLLSDMSKLITANIVGSRTSYVHHYHHPSEDIAGSTNCYNNHKDNNWHPKGCCTCYFTLCLPNRHNITTDCLLLKTYGIWYYLGISHVTMCARTSSLSLPDFSHHTVQKGWHSTWGSHHIIWVSYINNKKKYSAKILS